MNKSYFIAFHKPTGKYLKFNQLCDDGWGYYEPTINPEYLDLTTDYNRPDFFDDATLPPYINVRTGPGSGRKNDISISELEMHRVDINIVNISF